MGGGGGGAIFCECIGMEMTSLMELFVFSLCFVRVCVFFLIPEKTFKMFKNTVKPKSTSRKFAVNRTSVFLVQHDFDIRWL